MLIKIKPNEWYSQEEHWSVVVNRFHGEYKEGDHTLIFEREGWVKDVTRVNVLVRSSIKKWEAPYQEEVLTQEIQLQVLQRISSVFEFTGYITLYQD